MSMTEKIVCGGVVLLPREKKTVIQLFLSSYFSVVWLGITFSLEAKNATVLVIILFDYSYLFIRIL